MISLTFYQTPIIQLCDALRVQSLELFGSAVRDDFHANSDIDVLATFEGQDHLFDRYFDLKGDAGLYF